jgi:hypothetical protein
MAMLNNQMVDVNFHDSFLLNNHHFSPLLAPLMMPYEHPYQPAGLPHNTGLDQFHWS